MSFPTPAREAWNYAHNLDLNAQYQRVLGPISAFIWGCQVLSWQCNDDFMVVTDEGETLHLLQSPLQQWEQSCKHSWMKFIMSRCHFAQSWPEIWVPFRTWESLWSSREGPPPLATKFRTLGLLTVSAVASVQQRDNPMCEFCDDPNGGQLHIATECRAFRDIRDAPENNLLWEAHPFTQCTGIPCRARPAEPLPDYISQPNDSWTGHAFIFTDGSASPPELPQARLSSWSVVAARDKLAPIYTIVSGLTPGIYHDICRAETFAVLQAVMAFQGGIIFCDNASVVATWNNILSSNLDMFTLRGHPNYDLWTQIISLLVAKGPGNFSARKIKAHRSHEEASGAEDNWLITGNEKADEAAKQALFQGKLHHEHPIWSASDERKLIQQAKACGQFLSRVTQHAMSLRKAREPHHREEYDVEARVLPEEQILVQRPVPRPWSFPNRLMCHYFNELRWPSEDSADPGKVSLLELMLDLFITFQTSGPLNVRTLGRKFQQDVPIKARSSKYAYYYLPTPSQSRGLPGQLLTHASHTFLRSFDFLFDRGVITLPRENLYCLGMWGYNNVVPAIRCRTPSWRETWFLNFSLSP